MTKQLTVAKAKKTLAGKLAFGNVEQIRARKFLENVALCKEAIEACEHAEEHEECIANIRHCRTGVVDYTEEISYDLESCCCEHFKEDVICAAIFEIRYK